MASCPINFTVTEVNPLFQVSPAQLNFAVTEVVINFPQSSSEIQFGVTQVELNFQLVGSKGEKGDPAEDDMPYATRVDFIEGSPEIIYRAEGNAGSVDADAVWRIRRITIQSDDGDVVIEWADGDIAFDNIWDNHLILSYS